MWQSATQKRSTQATVPRLPGLLIWASRDQPDAVQLIGDDDGAVGAHGDAYQVCLGALVPEGGSRRRGEGAVQGIHAHLIELGRRRPSPCRRPAAGE